MRGDYSALGRPGESTRIDLTLGEDRDGDGLPDAWERTLITASGGKLTLRTSNLAMISMATASVMPMNISPALTRSTLPTASSSP